LADQLLTPLTLPPAGSDLVVILNGTAAITLTVPVPTKDMDGTELTIVSNGAAAHVPTFTGGVGAAGSSYDAFTFNSTSGQYDVVADGGMVNPKDKALFPLTGTEKLNKVTQKTLRIEYVNDYGGATTKELPIVLNN
jgi:hypothetical protein